jgi:hypothetical protein
MGRVPPSSEAIPTAVAAPVSEPTISATKMAVNDLLVALRQGVQVHDDSDAGRYEQQRQVLQQGPGGGVQLGTHFAPHDEAAEEDCHRGHLTGDRQAEQSGNDLARQLAREEDRDGLE